MNTRISQISKQADQYLLTMSSDGGASSVKNYDADIDGKPNTQGKGVVLISYVWGDDSSKLLALSDERRFEQFLQAIKGINPTFGELLESQTEKVQSIDWENTDNFYGAFKLNYPGQEQDNKDVFFQYQTQNQGVILAGDSVFWAGGWLEGAMPTGINAACAVAAYVGATLTENSPLTEIPADMYVYDMPPPTPCAYLKNQGYFSAPNNSAYDFGTGNFSLEAWKLGSSRRQTAPYWAKSRPTEARKTVVS